MTAPTDADLGQAVLALDELLRDPRSTDRTAVLRAAAPVGLLDQLAAGPFSYVLGVCAGCRWWT